MWGEGSSGGGENWLVFLDSKKKTRDRSESVLLWFVVFLFLSLLWGTNVFFFLQTSRLIAPGVVEVNPPFDEDLVMRAASFCNAALEEAKKRPLAADFFRNQQWVVLGYLEGFTLPAGFF